VKRILYVVFVFINPIFIFVAGSNVPFNFGRF